MQASNYLDNGYQILKNGIKDILDQNQTTNQLSYSKLLLPMQLLCDLLKGRLSDSFNSSQSVSSSLTSTMSNSTVCQKVLVDILIMLWESYFSKHLVNYSFMFHLLTPNNYINSTFELEECVVHDSFEFGKCVKYHSSFVFEQRFAHNPPLDFDHFESLDFFHIEQLRCERAQFEESISLVFALFVLELERELVVNE